MAKVSEKTQIGGGGLADDDFLYVVDTSEGEGKKVSVDGLRDAMNSGNLKIANNLDDLADAATARANLGVYSTTEVDDAIAAGGGGSGDLLAANNLSDLADIATARTNLDVYSTDEVDTLTAGGGGIGFAEPLAGSTSASGSAFATKGNIVNTTEAVTILGCYCRITTSGTYKFVVAQLETSGNTITSILGSSSARAVTATKTEKFALTSTASAASGVRLALLIVRTDGTATSVCGVDFPTAVGLSGWGFNYFGTSRYASNNPAVSDAVLFDTTSSVGMTLVYGV